jgi:hypothetical protein
MLRPTEVPVQTHSTMSVPWPRHSEGSVRAAGMVILLAGNHLCLKGVDSAAASGKCAARDFATVPSRTRRSTGRLLITRGVRVTT